MNATGSSNPVMRNTLIWSAIVIGALALVGALVGWLVDGSKGLASAVVAIVVAGLFLGFTAFAVLLAGRTPLGSTAFFAIFIGVWLLKFLVFIGVMLVLRMQEWISPFVFFFSLVAAVAASLIVDLVVFARTRVPAVGDVALPGAEGDGAVS